MKKMIGKVLSCLLSLAMLIAMAPIFTLSAYAGATVNVETAEELRSEMGAAEDKTVKLTADVEWNIDDEIDVKGNKVLELNGHKIKVTNDRGSLYPLNGGNLRVDGNMPGSKIISSGRIFVARYGNIIVDGGTYISEKNLATIYDNAYAGDKKLEINNGYFRSTSQKSPLIYSYCGTNPHAVEIVINGGTFISDNASVWESAGYDVTKGVVNGGTFYSKAGKKAFNIWDTGNKFVGGGKYLVSDGAHTTNFRLWKIRGSFIQVGNNASDFVDVTMAATVGGKGYFFKKNGKEGTVSALKNNELPIVAVPDAGKELDLWQKVLGGGSFEDRNLMETYYFPASASTLKPVFMELVDKPVLGIIGIYKYDGTEQTADVSGYDPATMDIAGNKQTNAGLHTISVTPKAGSWMGGSNEAATVQWTIDKEKCNGAPVYTKIETAGKTLADANLGVGTILPGGGVLNWDLPLATDVVQGTSYAWTYTPADAVNYENLTGSITPWAAAGGAGGGGAGGGGGVAPTYAVTVEKAENGSVSSSHGSAAEGTTVVLTVTPDKGYILDNLTVLDSKDKGISITKDSDKYSFKMPGSKVSVKATFKKGEEQPGANAADNEVKFTDVKDSDYFAKAVAWAVSKGITTGTSATMFSPNAPCTRAQIVTFLWRAAGKPEPQKTDNPFTDVKADAYYNKALLWAVEQGIVNGTSKAAFSPNATCTRGQMAAILYRYAKSPEVKGGKTFSDVADNAYYANAVKWAAEQGITSGTSATSFSPDATCTRAQIVTFLYRYMVK